MERKKESDEYAVTWGDRLIEGTSHGIKRTYRSAIYSFHTIFALLNIPTPFSAKKEYPRAQVDIFMALATMASYKAASTCRGAKCAAEDAWLLSGM